MKKLSVTLLILAFFVLPSIADAITCPVDLDTYILHGSMTHNGYPAGNELKAIAEVQADALVHFNLSGINDYNGDGVVNGNDIMDAKFRYCTHDCSGMMCLPMAPAGTTQTASIFALDVWSGHPYGLTYWTEASQGDYEHGYISGEEVPYNYDPGNVSGTELSMSYNLGPGNWGEVSITSIVKSWLDGDYLNNGIRVEDYLDGENAYGWYWSSKDISGAGQGPGDPAKIHYLDVTPVPEPATLLLLGAGLVGLFGVSRGKKVRS